MQRITAAAIGLAAGAAFIIAHAQRSEATDGVAAPAAPGVVLSAPGPDPGATRPIGLHGGAPSIDALLTEFLDAVERRDTETMHRLRITKEEYQRIIIPGYVAPGQPPRRISEQPREFFWQVNDRKSHYAAEAIVNNYGGRHYSSRDLRLTKGTRQYAWYTVHGEVRLDLRAPDLPRPAELRTGSIAEVDGQYKFIAFQWDD